MLADVGVSDVGQVRHLRTVPIVAFLVSERPELLPSSPSLNARPQVVNGPTSAPEPMVASLPCVRTTVAPSYG